MPALFKNFPRAKPVVPNFVKLSRKCQPGTIALLISDKPKIFCIGFHKTGSTSLAKALNTLDFKVCRRFGMLKKHFPEVDFADRLKSGDLDIFFEVVPWYDAFCDNPWPHIYKELDQHFPGSKFILTIRDEDTWTQSVKNYFGDSPSKLREWIYGESSPLGHEQLYLRRYQKHNCEVREYFANSPEKLLVLDLEKGEGWKQLCGFLEKPVPDASFPHLNKTAVKKAKGQSGLFRSFRNMDPKEKRIASEAVITLAVCRLLIVCFSFRKIAGLLGVRMQESPATITSPQLEEVKVISNSLEKLSPRLPFRSMCFEQALAFKLMLNRRKISSTVYFGVRSEKDSKTPIKAHAWTRSGDFYATGTEGKEEFKVVSFFGST